MTYLSEATSSLIADFGVEVEVIPQESPQAENTENPMYFTEGSKGQSFTEDVRLITSATEERLQEYGFEDEAEDIIYNDNDSINQGDHIKYSDNEYVVNDVETNNLGNGTYQWVYDLRRIK